jgi:hypothetical protein
MLSTEYEIHESMGRSLIGGDLMGKKMERWPSMYLHLSLLGLAHVTVKCCPLHLPTYYKDALPCQGFRLHLRTCHWVGGGEAGDGVSLEEERYEDHIWGEGRS